MTRLFLVAGEPSGDLLGGALIAGLRQLCGDGLILEGVGGPAMAAQGLVSRFPMEELSVMGLAEVLPRLPNLLAPHPRDRRRRGGHGPDALVTIDSPDFSPPRREARAPRSPRPAGNPLRRPLGLGLAPRPRAEDGQGRRPRPRAPPFEPPYMEAAGMTCDFVGHPVAAEPQATPSEIAAIRAELGIAPASALLVLLPARAAAR